mgnify:CR=1 FL=1
MIIDDLLGMSTDKLEQMTDLELYDYLKPCLVYSRPDLLRPKTTTTPGITLPKLTAEQLLKQLGITGYEKRNQSSNSKTNDTV